ncbi:Ig domain-containing protein [Pyxidicoccus sp. MSG2]|uniref:Ig domain-containing protein n=1 Tax=Pyxidicoccus sp. MSG2 TaxID=2996790 RepID=UPI002271E289|nr:DUF6519 domain-containing protein [Pyxidicoccus sp. MSG2]MCY1019282.1 DUF6519 domain-containing protein [Pyxidicoccus sp. MSG2]
MSRSISREDFKELKNYLGVYLQQGRVLLDSDWNENQDIAVSFLRRLNREALGEGSPNTGFNISPVFPPPPQLLLKDLDTSGMDLNEAIGAIIGACLADLLSLMLYLIFGPVLFFLSFPGKELDNMESLTGLVLSSPQGKLRIGKDRPYSGKGFLRLSGHAGTVTFTRTLPGLTDLSAHELLTFRYRLNAQVPGTIRFFLQDDAGNRSVWLIGISAMGAEIWLAGFAAPLDLRFRIVTSELQPAVKDKSYSAQVFSFAGKVPMTWTATGLPAGLTLTADGTGEDSRTGKLSGTPTTAGDFTFTVKVKGSDNVEVSRQLTLKVKPTGEVGLALPSASELLGKLQKFETPTGTPANLARIVKYGFEVYQDSTTPLVWDFDDLRLASTALEKSMGENNFIIRGSELSQFLNQVTLLSALQGSDLSEEDPDEEDDNLFLNLLNLLNADFQLSEPSIENAGRLYVAGLPIVQVQDVLYSQQADPNDPLLTPPPVGTKRTDTVYLDVWTEPVTYVEDPEIREIALGGPDSSTRLRTRNRVRVAQGGVTPTGNGVGLGTLATEGSYTAQANRLYRVEVDTAGNIGTATFRWSEDNASTLQRIIEPIPPGSKRVVVEDAAAFRKGDFVLIRKEFGEEEHRISTVFGNVITLEGTTGGQLALLPAASRVTAFTTFSLDDRPMLQRWNGFRVPIPADPADATLSSAILLNDGVQVRFGGRAMRRGDHWSFKTRYLAGDESSGINPETRIEQLAFQRARGVVHHYVPLATFTRDGSDDNPNRIYLIQDRRKRVANAGTVATPLPKLTGLSGKNTEHLGALALPPTAADSKFVLFWSGELFLSGTVHADAQLTLRMSFYNDEMTDPEAEPDKGKIQDREVVVKLGRKPKNVEVPLQHIFSKSDTPFLFLSSAFVPTSVQVFATLNDPATTPSFTVELTNMQLTALELKKGY